MGAVSSVVHAVGKVVKPVVKAAANVVTAGAYNHMQNKAKDQARKAQAQAARQQAQAEEQQSQNANMANKKHANVGDTVVDDTHDPGGNAGKYDHDKNTGKIESHSCKINFVGSNDLINGITKKYGNIQLQNYSDCCQDHT